MSFPRYPKYKASGVEWLGEVPDGWVVKPVRQLATVVNGFPFDSKLFDPTEGIPLIRIRDLNQAETDTCYKGEFVERAAITSDDVLVGMDGDFNVGRWMGKGRALLNQRMCCIRGKSRLLTRLLEYLLPIPLKAINEVTYATTVKHLASSQIEKTLVALPPTIEEQTAIAEFLDRETEKIDELVAEQRRLIELLKEKRQAVISHAVTKGLNPHAPMKPSGIVWLGVVPVGWVTCALKRVVRMQSGESITAESIAETGNYPVYGGNGLRGFTSEFTHNGTYVLIGRQGALCGNINYAFEKFWASEHAVVATPTKPVDTFWLGEMLRAMNLNQYSIAAAQPGLSVELVGRLGIPLPPLAEQMAIAAYLTKELAKFDTLTAEAQRAIDLLQERRTALISAAVTGQIDVREVPL